MTWQADCTCSAAWFRQCWREEGQFIILGADWDVFSMYIDHPQLRQHWHTIYRLPFSFGVLFNTRRGRSRAWHVLDREVDYIERVKKWGLGHLRRSKGEASWVELTFWLCFRGKEANGKARRAEPKFGTEPTSPFLVAHAQHSIPRSLAIGFFQGNQYIILSSTVLFRAIAFQQTVLPPSRVVILCQIARKSWKISFTSCHDCLFWVNVTKT